SQYEGLSIQEQRSKCKRTISSCSSISRSKCRCCSRGRSTLGPITSKPNEGGRAGIKGGNKKCQSTSGFGKSAKKPSKMGIKP
ncbi:hypothetical protein PIB30_101935, partial [Stylosanthes scabra]|nr:hypothetical protein [Stylosanthes scabra]